MKVVASMPSPSVTVSGVETTMSGSSTIQSVRPCGVLSTESIGWSVLLEASVRGLRGPDVRRLVAGGLDRDQLCAPGAVRIEGERAFLDERRQSVTHLGGHVRPLERGRIDVPGPRRVDARIAGELGIGTVIIDDVYVPLQIDPSVRDVQGNVWQGSKIILDATQKIDSGPFSLPPRPMMMKALDLWKQCKLPEFEIPNRAQLTAIRHQHVNF